MRRDERRAKLNSNLRPDVAEMMSSAIFKQIESGQLEPAKIWAYFAQYQHYCTSFPRFLGALLSRTNLPVARQPLIENLWEESGSGDVRKSHVEMLETFLKSWGQAIGLTEAAMASRAPKNPVVSFVDDISSYLASASMPSAFGFIGPGTEEITSEQYAVFLTGLRSYGLVDESKLEFFAAHIDADIRHANVFWDALDHIAIEESDWVDVERGARQSLKRETKFWKEMAETK